MQFNQVVTMHVRYKHNVYTCATSTMVKVNFTAHAVEWAHNIPVGPHMHFFESVNTCDGGHGAHWSAPLSRLVNKLLDVKKFDFNRHSNIFMKCALSQEGHHGIKWCNMSVVTLICVLTRVFSNLCVKAAAIPYSTAILWGVLCCICVCGVRISHCVCLIVVTVAVCLSALNWMHANFSVSSVPNMANQCVKLQWWTCWINIKWHIWPPVLWILGKQLWCQFFISCKMSWWMSVQFTRQAKFLMFLRLCSSDILNETWQNFNVGVYWKLCFCEIFTCMLNWITKILSNDQSCYIHLFYKKIKSKVWKKEVLFSLVKIL